MDWKKRIENKAFWVALIPAVLLLVQQVLAIFGISIETEGLQEHLLGVVGTIFAILAILGICVDPTTEGVSDFNVTVNEETDEEANDDN